jgi:excisionase family DNA binding protein
VPKRKLYDQEGAAAYCYTTERHIERLRYERKLAYIKVGGKVRFEEEALDALLNSDRMDALR